MFVPDANFNQANANAKTLTPAEAALAAGIALTSLALGFSAALYGAALATAGALQPRR